MKKEIKETIQEDVPLATMVIRDYRDTVKRLTSLNKRLIVVIGMLLIMISILGSYVIFAWDSLNPDAGVITTSTTTTKSTSKK